MSRPKITTNYVRNKLCVRHNGRKWYVDGTSDEGGIIRGFNIRVTHGEEGPSDHEVTVFKIRT